MTHSRLTTVLRRKSPLRVLVIAVVFAAILGLVMREQTHLANAYRLATSHYPETYSELYFVNSTKLPTRATPGRKYTFTVHLASHQPTQTYQLLSTVTIAGEQTVTTMRTISLRDGSGADVTFSLVIPKSDQTAQVVVAVANTTQSIAFRSQS
jgi:hypothetical protein